MSRMAFAAVASALVLAGLLYSVMSAATTSDSAQNISQYLAGPMARLSVLSRKEPLSDHILQTADGSPVALRDMKGKAMLINLWASYCAPCRMEMPELSKLQAELGGDDFAVVAINVDRGGYKMAAEILEEWGVPDLDVYADPTSKIAFDLAKGALPMSLIVNKDGQIIAQYLGALKWDAPEAIALFTALKAGQL